MASANSFGRRKEGWLRKLARCRGGAKGVCSNDVASCLFTAHRPSPALTLPDTAMVVDAAR
jgi:hypothetical protein